MDAHRSARTRDPALPRTMESVREYHPESVKPGMTDRLRNYIRGRVNSSEVSTQYHVFAV